MIAGGAGGRQGLGVPVSNTVTVPTWVTDEACEADTWLERLSALSPLHNRKKWHGIKTGPDGSFSVGIVFYFFLMFTNVLLGNF